MIKGRKSEVELKLARVTVQVSAVEKELINRLANSNGLSVGAYIRKLCIYDQWERLGGSN